MAKKPDVVADLSGKMTQALEAQRDQGGPAYPTTLGRLGELADPAAPPDRVLKAAGKRPFSERAVVAKKKSLDAPVALREDVDRLAASPSVLEFVLRATCTEAVPTATPAKLKTKLDKALRDPFVRAVQRQVAENALPPDVEWLPKEKALHPRWLPRPKPPEVDLAERLVRVLEGQRQLGPLRLSRLIELSGPGISARLLNKAKKQEPFASRVVSLTTKPRDPLVVLADDLERAAGSPALLNFLLETARGPTEQAFSVSDLKARLARPAQGPFSDALRRQIETGSLPAGVGWIGTKKQQLLFRIEDVRGARPPAPAPPVTPPAGDWEATFDEAFARLDRQNGSYNFVSLVDLRRALPWDRAAFDGRLRRLREAGRYTLSAAEGRHGITEEQRAAAIPEEGSLLLFASRTRP